MASSDPRAVSTVSAEIPPAQPLAERLLDGAWWTCRLVAALFLFVGALQVMKTGAGGLVAWPHGELLLRNAGSTLGLGWMGALFVLSGSPIAASALTLVAAGTISELQGFTMLSGSRIGASFVVLVVAVVYALRGGAGKRKTPVSVAVMAFSTTTLVYVPGAILGFVLLRSSPIQNVELQLPGQFGDTIDLFYGGLLEHVQALPAALQFLVGLGILLLSMKVIDSVMPEISEETLGESHLGWLRQKWPMFGLGCLVAFITMSVSVALTVLVPVVTRGYVKRQEIIPYIMGANITTLGDTLFAAFVLDSFSPVRIVLAAIAGTLAISLMLLMFFYSHVMRGTWEFQRQMLVSQNRLAGFTAAIFLLPLAIIAISAMIG